MHLQIKLNIFGKILLSLKIRLIFDDTLAKSANAIKKLLATGTFTEHYLRFKERLILTT